MTEEMRAADRLDQYLTYHRKSAEVGDIDPAHSMLLYLCNRFELNLEQRYWLAFLYAITYCGASVYYVYNEFPDFENLDVGRLERWWTGGGRDAIICQTDRRWCRSNNQFVAAIQSYMEFIGESSTQHKVLTQITPQDSPEQRYESLMAHTRMLYTFGQFTQFLYLEALHTITPLDLCPTTLDLNQAWSCRDGLYYAYGVDKYIRDESCAIPPGAQMVTACSWMDLRERLPEANIWQLETTLCAYRKFQNGKRHIGSYLDRQADEIAKMEARVPNGVAWRVLWEYRSERLNREWLAEAHGWVSPKGVHKKWVEYGRERTKEVLTEKL